MTSSTPAREDSPRAGDLAGSRQGRYHVLTRYDRRILILMVGVPLLLDVALIWWPTLSSVLLSFTNWDGVGPVTAQNFIGLKNYQFMFSGYTLFWPAFLHNIIWLAWLALIATPLGIFFAVLLDREISGTGFYHSVFFLPLVLSV